MALTATEALEFMNAAWAEGRTVLLTLMGSNRVTKITARNKASWDRAGLTIAKADPDVSRHLLLASGRGFVCYDLAVTAVRSVPGPARKSRKK